MSQKKLEEQMILRLPPQVADQVRKMLRTKQLTEEIEFEFDEDSRNAKFKVGKKKYNAYLVDLPCFLESHKTLDKTTYYKSADIGQMLVVQDPNEPQPPPSEFRSPNGVTTATRDIQRRKWRKPPDAAEMKEIEMEVNRLLKPSENESIEILNADDYEDLDELNGVVEKVEPAKPPENKIRFKMPSEDGGHSTHSAEPVAEAAKEKKKKERKKKEKKPKEGDGGEKEKEGEVKIKKEKEVTGEGEVKAKKEKRRRKKKEEEGEADGHPEGGGATPAATGEKKKATKKRERKPKAKDSEAANTTPLTPSSASAPAFPFSNTITQPPPPMAMPNIPSVFVQQPISTKIATPAFNANPFANALNSSGAFTSPITTTPIQQPITITTQTTPISTLSHSHSQPLHPIVPPSSPAMGSGGSSYQQLLAQQKKLQQEVDQLKLKVTAATNKYNILPNAILKQRQQGALQEVTEQHAQKVKELEMVEKQLKEMGPR